MFFKNKKRKLRELRPTRRQMVKITLKVLMKIRRPSTLLKLKKPIKKILIQLKKKVKSPSTPNKIKNIKLAQRSVVAELVKFFSERGAIKKNQVQAYTKVYDALYKKAHVVQAVEKIEPTVKITRREKAVEKIEPTVKITPNEPRKHSKNWIEKEIWDKMTGKAKREFIKQKNATKKTI